MHLILRILIPSDVSGSEEIIQRISDLYQEFEHYENFGSIFLPGLSILASKIPLLKGFLGHAVTNDKEVYRRRGIVTELIELIRPAEEKRMAVKSLRESGEASGGIAENQNESLYDELQAFIDAGGSFQQASKVGYLSSLIYNN